MCNNQLELDFVTLTAETIASRYSEREIFVGVRWKTRHLPTNSVILYEEIADKAIRLQQKTKTKP